MDTTNSMMVSNIHFRRIISTFVRGLAIVTVSCKVVHSIVRLFSYHFS